MTSKYNEFDRSSLELEALAQRQSDYGVESILPLQAILPTETMETVAGRLVRAKDAGGARILMMGAHVLRSGAQRYLIELMDMGLVSCIATNGASAIHDFELALIGRTTESVARYIADGRFGFWRETGWLNAVIRDAAANRLGLGEAVGKAVSEGDFLYKDLSLFAAAYTRSIPVTVHVGIGHDIIHQHPDCDGGALGETSYRDFLIFAQALTRLSGGVVMNFGSAVMAPEVFLKALSMVRNKARQKGETVRNFTTLVCDLHNMPVNYAHEAQKTNPNYYFRPWKTMLVRTVAEGGESFYQRGTHCETIPQLWTAAARQTASAR